ncbi:hypothetical protein [Exiguobacterium sp. s131]|uniref:hypothetical protein n=1 Tax=Exiguobacterium sp. s131 TaxID=2751278 RepID=UPI001BE4E3BE|nr:hypothetical protein [Exiguobacterium sp. s131]
MSLWKKSTNIALSFLLVFSFVGSASATTTVNQLGLDDDQLALEEAALNNQLISKETEEDLIEIFSAIETLPDEVVEDGTEAVVEYLDEQISSDINLEQDGDVVAFGAWACSNAIGLALLTNVLPIAKITKIKEVIKSAGGAVTFAKTLVNSYNSARKFNRTKSYAIKFAVKEASKKAAPDAISAALGFFNISNVAEACFE